MKPIKSRYLLLMSLVLLLILSSLSLVPLLAQSNDTVITVAIEEFQQNFLGDEAFDAFEEAHPGVNVVTVIIPNDDRYFASPQEASEVEDFIDNVNNLASQADLLPFDMFNGPRMKTRAGMYLDINPLLNADPNANIDDFYAPMLESMQWDGGTWGLPMSGSVQIVVYDKNAFDEAGLAYPSTAWTLDDFINAGIVLTQFDSEGNVTAPGFFGFDTSLLFASVIDGDLSDPSAFPSRPLLNTSENIHMVEQWAAYEADYSPDFSNGGFSFNFDEIPLTINSTFVLNDEMNFGGNSDADFEGVLLPGNQAGLQIQAYGISAGTANPQLAYELLQYMSSTPEIAFSFFGDSPARQSLVTADVDDLPIFRPDVSPELQGLIDEAMMNAIPANRLHFISYLSYAVSLVNNEEEPVDAETALQDYQDQFTEVFDALEASATTNILEVATPVPTPILQAGEISLTFGMESNFGPGVEREIMQAAIDDFVAQDPQVRQIVIDNQFYSFEERIEQQDCFYSASNPVQSADLSLFYSIDPFLTTDANLDFNNFVNGTLDQVSRDNAIWGMPLSLAPQVMWYNPERFAEAGLPEPSNDWTIFEFVDALHALDAVSDGAPYRSQGFGGSYLYMLMAAYGGFPIDYTTSPYTINVSDPVTVEAIRQVLNLAEQGLLDYQESSIFGGGGGGGSNSDAIYDSILSPNDWRIQSRGEEFGINERVVMFPRGVDYIPVSYTLGVGLISANTPAPDACYRWLSFLSRRGELMQGMPAQVDMFEASVASLTDADDIVALYEAFNAALQSPNVVIVPSAFSGNSADPVASTLNFLSQNWVSQAFDLVVLEDADLDTALADAQMHINDFISCTNGIPPLEGSMSQLSDEEQGEYFSQFLRCAVDVDPSLEEFFGPALDEDED